MDYISGFCGAIGSGINRASTYTGGVVNTLIEGKYGLGTLHGKTLAAGSYCWNSRLAHVLTQSATGVGMACFGFMAVDSAEHDERKVKKGFATVTEKVWNGPDKTMRYFAMPLMLALTTGAIYIANATNCGVHQLTAAAAKEVLAKTALTLGDAYAIYKTLDGKASKSTRGLAASYLAARLLDTLVNFGAASRGLVRCNPQPLLSNLSSIASWVR